MYEKHFRLRELPFNLTPDPRFLYTHASCQEAFATLCYGVEHRKGIVLITGAAGTGKTTLIKLFMEKAAQRVRAACILDPHLTFVELLQCALDAFGLTELHADRVSLMQQFRDYLLEQHSQNYRVALLLDEAQDIQEEVLEQLRLISDLEEGGDRLVQLVLAGQSEFEARLEQPRFHQLRQRVTLRSRLQALSEGEIGPYIDLRLRTAGYSERSIFQRAAIQHIGYFSQGIPRLINVICDHALLIACATNVKTIGAETIDEIADDLHFVENRSELRNAPLVRTTDATPSTIADTEKARLSDEFAGELSDPQFPLSIRPLTSNQSALRAELGSLWMAAQRLGNKSWIGLSLVAASIMFLVLSGVYLARSDNETISVPTNGINAIQDGLGPLSQELYRALGRGASWETPLRQTQRSYTDLEPHESKSHQAEAKLRTDPGKQADAARPRNDSSQRASTETKRPPIEPRNPQPPRPALSSSGFAVVGNSYVREKPASKAEIIATLRPGTRIQVVGRTGEYFRVRSLDNEGIRGYVHKEDAFFEPYH
jgi:type II secretory pathway predicted ATPase ExeA